MTLILVADASRARLCSWNPTQSKLQILEEFAHPESRLHSRDLVSDRPGRTQAGPGGGRAAMDQRSDAHKREAERFATELAARLQREIGKSGPMTRLAVVAPPAFLGHLRNKFSRQCTDALRETAAADLCSVRDHDLKQAVAKHFFWGD